MKAVARPWVGKPATERGTHLIMWCPGCEDLHPIEIDRSRPTSWEWNGDYERPTVNPSIKVTGRQWAESYSFHKRNHHVATGQQTVCHSFVRDGRWEFLSDCTHHLAGQRVEMVDIPEGTFTP